MTAPCCDKKPPNSPVSTEHFPRAHALLFRSMASKAHHATWRQNSLMQTSTSRSSKAQAEAKAHGVLSFRHFVSSFSHRDLISVPILIETSMTCQSSDMFIHLAGPRTKITEKVDIWQMGCVLMELQLDSKQRPTK